MYHNNCKPKNGDSSDELAIVGVTIFLIFLIPIAISLILAPGIFLSSLLKVIFPLPLGISWLFTIGATIAIYGWLYFEMQDRLESLFWTITGLISSLSLFTFISTLFIPENIFISHYYDLFGFSECNGPYSDWHLLHITESFFLIFAFTLVFLIIFPAGVVPVLINHYGDFPDRVILGTFILSIIAIVAVVGVLHATGKVKAKDSLWSLFLFSSMVFVGFAVGFLIDPGNICAEIVSSLISLDELQWPLERSINSWNKQI